MGELRYVVRFWLRIYLNGKPTDRCHIIDTNTMLQGGIAGPELVMMDGYLKLVPVTHFPLFIKYEESLFSISCKVNYSWIHGFRDKI